MVGKLKKGQVWIESDFTGLKDVSGKVSIQGKVIKAGILPEELFRELFPGHRINHTGLDLSEILGSYHWMETAISYTHKGSSYQHLVCITGREQLNYVIFLSTQDNLTRSSINIIPNLLSTFSWR